MPRHHNLLTLTAARWYAYQMLPGYGERGSFAPYVSPIYIEAVTPLGSGLLKVSFINVAYADGPPNFEQTFRMLQRSPTHVVAAIGGEEDQTAIIGEIGFDWIRQFFGDWWKLEPADGMREPYRSDVQAYLGRRLRLLTA